MDSDDHNLLQALEAHGQQFLRSFALPHSEKKGQQEVECVSGEARTLQESDEEWIGIGHAEYPEDNVSDGSQEIEDDELRAESSSRTFNVVLFSETSARLSSESNQNKAQMKAFMSSKISKLRHDAKVAKRSKCPSSDSEEEHTNAHNDAILHRLVHTKLLSGSLNPELDLKPAQRRKALAGRVLELTGEAKLGKGEKLVRDFERNKAAKRVRIGLAEKQREREKVKLEEAKQIGNYHPTIKKIFDGDSTSGPAIRMRERGLKIGVGKYRGGVLTLSREDISRGQGKARPRGLTRGGRRRAR